MSQDDPKQALSPTRFARSSKDDAFTWHWDLSDKSLIDGVAIKLPPRHVVPIVFVPGIMGSNLRVTQDVDGVHRDEPVWVTNGGLGAAWAWNSASAARRQLRLNPAITDVYAGGEVPGFIATIGDEKAIRERRYWGEVSGMSYIKFLQWLQSTLNGQTFDDPSRKNVWASLNQRDFLAQWGALDTFVKQSTADVDRAALIRFPVYACGYNWLQSNLKSAERLANRIDEIIRANNFAPLICDQVILVTHSMGGLVARACSELKGMSAKIAGVVHGVMPATGAAAAYKRARAGTEGMAGVVLGSSAETVSAVFANAPGALQLLPNQFYPKRWLKIGRGTGANFVELAAMPERDPYTEIYGLPDSEGRSVRGAWWSLMREELINPARVQTHPGWERYLRNLELAKSFHTDLATRYHHDTYAFYGDDSGDDRMTWECVRWECKGVRDIANPSIYDKSVPPHTTGAALMKLPSWYDDGHGECGVRSGNDGYRLQLSSKDTGGDGTVPSVSGHAPQEAKAQYGATVAQVYRLRGFEHQAAYDNELARQVTLHSILQITAKIQFDKKVKA